MRIVVGNQRECASVPLWRILDCDVARGKKNSFLPCTHENRRGARERGVCFLAARNRLPIKTQLASHYQLPIGAWTCSSSRERHGEKRTRGLCAGKREEDVTRTDLIPTRKERYSNGRRSVVTRREIDRSRYERQLSGMIKTCSCEIRTLLRERRTVRWDDALAVIYDFRKFRKFYDSLIFWFIFIVRLARMVNIYT